VAHSMGWTIVLVAFLIAFLIGTAGAGYCKFFADCHIRGPQGLEDLEGVGGGEMQLPTGFRVVTVANGLHFPTDFAFLPGGRVAIAEKDGLIRLVKDRRLMTKPLLDIRQRVNSSHFRGLIDVTVDPDFGRRPFLYVIYTARGSDPHSADPTSVRVSRFRVEGDVADPASERVLLGGAGGSGRSCLGLTTDSDCIPAELDHIGADIAFAPDGTLFIATGDGGGHPPPDDIAFLSQNIDSLAGKILHVDRSGNGEKPVPHRTRSRDGAHAGGRGRRRECRGGDQSRDTRGRLRVAMSRGTCSVPALQVEFTLRELLLDTSGEREASVDRTAAS
jgi:glucose/arabinose dehydrogenase